jgi:tetratricopeptide (TPR) repeat protein
MRFLLLGYCLLFSITAYEQQVNSAEIFPTPGRASFIYHPKSKTLLLIGGVPTIPDSVRSTVWKWNGKNWVEIKAYGPGSRDFFFAALNTKNGMINSFGGIAAVNGERKGDLWTFDGNKWVASSSNNIDTRDHHSFVFADHLNAFVLYGGQYANRNADTITWLVKDGKFTPLYIPGPGIRYHSGMAYDKKRKKVVLYGGGERPDEHWEFDGTKWTRIITTINPGKKFYHFMVYDDNRQMIVLHGGWRNQDPRDTANFAAPITWTWNGREWKRISKENVFASAMGYDANRKVIVAFGRSDDNLNGELGVWELNGDKWIRKKNYGKWNSYDYVKQWVKDHPDDMLALMKYADLLQWQTKEFAEAEIVYKKLETIYPEKKEMLIDLALVLLMQIKMEEAEKYLIKVMNAGLLNRNVYLRLAGLLRMEKKFRESIPYLEKAIEIEPKGDDLYKLGCSYAYINNIDKAFENLNKAADKGYNSKLQFEASTELQSLKTDPRWQQLLNKLN